jgi:hypothetical protein
MGTHHEHRSDEVAAHGIKGKYMNTYPFAGVLKMEKVMKDGQEVIEWEQVDMTKDADGSMTDGVGITPNQEPVAFSFTAPATEWARVDKDLNVTHLDMELCAKGPQNAYTALAIAIWNKAIEESAKYAESDGDDVLADSIRGLKK